MNIAIIGAGNVGELLGRKWKPKHQVILGVRNPESDKSKALAERGVNIDTVQNAVDRSEIVVLAVPASAVESVVKTTRGLENKIIIDVTNPISTAVPEGFQSMAEAVAEWSGSSKVVKTLNQTGYADMENPKYGDIALDTLICGDDEDANNKAATLAKELGFEPFKAGGLKNASLLECLAKLRVALAFSQGKKRRIAFKLLKR
jgi:predicted dinucleotide-binding enzyme